MLTRIGGPRAEALFSPIPMIKALQTVGVRIQRLMSHMVRTFVRQHRPNGIGRLPDGKLVSHDFHLNRIKARNKTEAT
jgi:hypothetical protein